jgi:tetratricopeptide (TPR) repeat protein
MLIKQFSYSRATEYFLEAEKEGSEDQKARAEAGLTECYFKTKNWKKVEEYADKVIRLNESTATTKALIYKGEALSAQKQYAKAKQALTKALVNGKGRLGAEAQYELAMVYRMEKKYSTSTNEFLAIKKKYPKQKAFISKSYLMIAKNEIDQGNIEQAKANLRGILRSDVSEDTKRKARKLMDGLE